MKFVIAIPCYNEEQNIETLLETLDNGWSESCRPDKILIFSSACRDRTDTIVARFISRSHVPVVLAAERQRRGKCHAINRLMDMAGDVDVIVMISGDVLVDPAAIEILVNRFLDKKIGVAGGRPVPVSGKNGLVPRTVRTMWQVHHQIALLDPKTTEVTVFRPLGFRLDESSLVDEAEIEYHLSTSGFGIVYCPKVVIRNTSPEIFTDYIKQRTRVTLGHMVLDGRKGHRVGSIKTRVRLLALKRYLTGGDIDIVALAFMLAAEAVVWIFAKRQYKTQLQVRQGTWDRIDSTKRRL
ncbi:MAG: glycosyltransferase [Desulfobacterales bacterium]|nr:glycosyltransferase [Desulfobacterales bacterium]